MSHNYAFEHSDRRHRRIAQLESSRVFEDTLADCMCAPKEIGSLEEALGMIDESFASMVLRKMVSGERHFYAPDLFLVHSGVHTSFKQA